MNRIVRKLAVGSVLLAGCSTFVPVDEYSVYRNYRYESSGDHRTALGAQYISAYPKGQFIGVLQREVGDRDDEYWLEHRSTEEGARAYLNAFPSGLHKGEAESRIALFESRRKEAADREAAAIAAANAAREAQIRELNSRRRLFVRGQMLTWVRTFVSLDGWGTDFAGLAQHNPDFSVSFGGTPAPSCRAGRCRKTHHLDFMIPVPGRTAVQRSVDLSIDLFSRATKTFQAGLVLHNRGLSSWFECESEGFCDPSDPEQRANSVRWAMNQMKWIVATAFPNARETPAELLGPEPEMEGNLEDDPEAAARAAQPPPPIPAQPLGTQFSYVINCNGRGGAQIQLPADGAPVVPFTDPDPANVAPHSCIRIDGYSAPDVEGVSTDEGLRISFISPAAFATARPPRRR